MVKHGTLIQCPSCKTGSLNWIEEGSWECRSCKRPFKHYLSKIEKEENALGEEPHDGDIDYINIL